MTLEVIKDGESKTYPDEVKLPLNQWRKMLDLAPYTIADALYRQGLRPEDSPPRFPNQPNLVLIPIERFPDIIRGLGRIRITRSIGEGDYFHPWAANVETSQNFQVINHKGTTLKYTYTEK